MTTPLRSGTNAFRAIRSMRPTTVTPMVIHGVLPPDTPERLQRAVT